MVGSSFFFEFTLPRFFLQVVGEIFCQLATSIPPWQVLKGHSIVSKCHYGLQGINPDEWVCLYQEKMCVYCPHMSSPLTFTDPYPLTSHARPHLSPLSQAARHTMPAWITSNGPAGPVQGPPPITWKPWPGCPWWPWRGFYLTEWITLNNHRTDIVR